MTAYAQFSVESCRRYTKALEGRREIQRVYQSFRVYTKAPEGRADMENIRGPLDDHDDLWTTAFDFTFWVPDSRMTETVAPEPPR